MKSRDCLQQKTLQAETRQTKKLQAKNASSQRALRRIYLMVNMLMSLCNQAEKLLLDGLRVLVVDNHSDSRELLAFVLKQKGAEVATASCVDEAIAIIKQQKLDVLLSEICLPEKDGYELMHQVRTLAKYQLSSVVAIATSGCDGLEDRLLSLQAGFQAHVAKPIDFDRLTVLVQEMAACRAF